MLGMRCVALSWLSRIDWDWTAWSTRYTPAAIATKTTFSQSHHRPVPSGEAFFFSENDKDLSVSKYANTTPNSEYSSFRKQLSACFIELSSGQVEGPQSNPTSVYSRGFNTSAEDPRFSWCYVDQRKTRFVLRSVRRVIFGGLVHPPPSLRIESTEN